MRLDRLARLAIGFLLTSSLLLACSESAQEKDPLDLDERVFLLESSDGFTPVASTTVRLSFQRGELSISAGCNSMGGPFEVENAQLVLHGLSTTDIGCFAPGVHAQDDFLGEFITSRPALMLEGTTLTLRGAQVTMVFVDREVADPDRPLAGPPWTVDTWIQGGGAGSGSIRVPTTLEFTSEGTLLIEAVCHSGSGRYAVSGDKLTLTSIDLMDKSCGTESTDGQTFAVVKDGVLMFEIEADRLTLTRGDLGVSARRR
jgi:heat shock protein HslJ